MELELDEEHSGTTQASGSEMTSMRNTGGGCLEAVSVKCENADKCIDLASTSERPAVTEVNLTDSIQENSSIGSQPPCGEVPLDDAENGAEGSSPVDITKDNAVCCESEKAGHSGQVEGVSVGLQKEEVMSPSNESTVEHPVGSKTRPRPLRSKRRMAAVEAVDENVQSAHKSGFLDMPPTAHKCGLKKRVSKMAQIKKKTRRFTPRKRKATANVANSDSGNCVGHQQTVKEERTSRGAEATRVSSLRRPRIGRPPKVEQLEGEVEDDLFVHFQDHPYSTGDLLNKALGQSNLLPRKKPKNRRQCLKCEYCGKICTLPHNLRTHLRIHTGERPYSCEVCGKSFSTTSNLQVHKRVHTGERPYLCEQCGKSFRRVCHLQVHRKMHTGKLPFKCDHCRRSFSLQSELQQHLRFHTEDGLFKCLFCTKVYNIFSLLEKHMRTHTGEKPFQCHRCGKRFAQSSKVIEHMRIHTGERPYKCKICDKGFRASHFLINHMKSHTKEHTYLCELCGKTLHTQSGLITHKKNHAVEGSFKCQHCEKCYDHLSELNRHVKVHFEKWTYLCDLCGKSFRSLQDTQAHMKTHNVDSSDNLNDPTAVYSETGFSGDYHGDGLGEQGGSRDRQMKIQEHIRLFIGERPFVCKECGKRFAYANVLAKHMTTHTREKLYKCRRCGKNFSRKDDLQVHKRIHSGERPYTCDQCGKSFRVSSILSKHMRIHTGERPYTCEQCGKSFTQLGGLRTHLKTHMRDQSHDCHQCGKAFKSAGTLRKHMMFHSGERPYVCEECGKGFVQMGDLNKHRRVHAKAERKQAVPKYEQEPQPLEMGHLMEMYSAASQPSGIMAHSTY